MTGDPLGPNCRSYMFLTAEVYILQMTNGGPTSWNMDVLPTFLSYLLKHLPSQSEVIEWFQHIPPLIAVSGGILLWLALVRAFRWRRYNAMHRKYGPKWNNGKGIITPEEAQDIMSVSTRYDMPMLLNYALAFALFKTYGIVRLAFLEFYFDSNLIFQPSISKLLSSTKELKSKETVSKRYADVCPLYSGVA